MGDDSSGKKWNIDDLPSIITLKRLEIVNSILDKSHDSQNGIEIKSYKNRSYPALNELIFRNNGLKTFDEMILKIFPNIKILDLSQNEIHTIDPAAFHLTKENYLIELHLERNQIKSIDKQVLSSLHNLKYLNLKENKLDTLEDLALQSLNLLEILDLSRNKLTTLTDQTFTGLDNLKDLTLSYNPLKNIAPNTFKYLGMHSPLKRLEMISNTEVDWFVFDDNDLCMLIWFKCGIQIEIDHDQTCNCFVKYSNLIERVEKEGSDVDTLTSPEISIFKPCTIETKFSNQQDYKYENEINELPKFECPKIHLQNCYSTKKSSQYLDFDVDDDFLLNKSCLFTKLLDSSGSSKKKSLEYSSSSKEFTLREKNLMDRKDMSFSNQVEVSFDQTDKKITELEIKQQVVKRKNETSLFDKMEFSLDQKLKFILIVLGVLSTVSIFSISIAFYLLCRSNRIQYHQAPETDMHNK